MSQGWLLYSPAVTGREAWLAQLEVIRAAVIHLTPKEVIDEIDIAKSTLSQALSEAADKRWAAEWTHVVKTMLARRHDDVSTDLLRKLCEHDTTVTPFVVDEPRNLTPEQERDGYRSELARMGGDGKAAIDRALGKGKKR